MRKVLYFSLLVLERKKDKSFKTNLFHKKFFTLFNKCSNIFGQKIKYDFQDKFLLLF